MPTVSWGNHNDGRFSGSHSKIKTKERAHRSLGYIPAMRTACCTHYAYLQSTILVPFSLLTRLIDSFIPRRLEAKDLLNAVPPKARLYASPIRILLTGATGFLSKAVFEELFRHRDEYTLDKVIVLKRPKRGQDSKSKFLKEITSSPCFANFPRGWVDSVQAVEGDLALPNCGIEELLPEKIC
jgi:hypothetical protein